MILLETTLLVLFVLAAALVFGGTAALAFAAAPALFRTLPEDEAERGFGRVLEAFDRIAWASAGLGTLAGLGAAAVSRRWLPLAVAAGLLAVCFVVLTLLRRGLRPRLEALAPPPPEAGGKAAWDEASRRAFGRLHRLYVRAYGLDLLVAAAALAVALLP